MKIRVHDRKVQLRSLAKPIVIGYVFGFGVLLLPALVLMIPVIIFVPIETEGGNGGVLQLLMMLLLMPLILFFQGIMNASAVVLGLWVYRSRGKIEIEEVND